VPAQPQPPPPRRRVRGSTAFRRQAGLLRAQTIQAGRRARRRLAFLAPLLAAVVVAYLYRVELFGTDRPVRLATALALIVIGWSFARNLGHAVEPYLVRWLDPGAAGVAGFLVRLVALVATALISLRIAGLQPGTLVVGASFTAVIVGLAAQQTFGNMFAGLVLLSARPFQVGDRARFSGYGMDVEGTVTAHGLLYVTMTDGADPVMVPNSTALAMSVRPIREPPAVDMRARLPRNVDPETVQEHLVDALDVRTLGPPHVALEEVDGEEVVLHITATPVDSRDGGRLAREVLNAIAPLHLERARQPVA
jgi:small conductance mechanosensitive channel